MKFLNILIAGLKNPIDGKIITKVYEEGETYKNKFPKISSAYEECRAESVALYLSNNDDVLKIFGISDEEKEDAIYTLWLTMMHTALSSIYNYSPKSNKWNQAHRYESLRAYILSLQYTFRFKNPRVASRLFYAYFNESSIYKIHNVWTIKDKVAP